MSEEKKKIEPGLGLSLFIVIMMTAIMFVGVMLTKKVSIPACLIIIITLVMVISKFQLGYSFDEMMGFMAESVKNGTFGLWFFVAIGGIIASWMISGTVPAIIYYGLNLISPKIFLPAGLVLCFATAFATGSCWATVGTVGIALVGIGQGMGIPLPVTCGMIVSGASCGDKISPVSDTPNLTSMSSDADLYDTIKAMITTITPAFVIAFIMFAVLGMRYAGSEMNYAIIKETQSTLKANFNLNPVVLLPIVILLILNIKKFPSLPSMAIAITIGYIIAIFVQGADPIACLESLNSGFVIKTGSEYVDPILNRGGLANMMWTFSVAFLAISMGGLLDSCGYLTVIVRGMLSRVKSVGALSLLVLVTSFITTGILSEVYLAIILNGALYKKDFNDKGLDTAMLARLISEGSLMPAPLMPWTTYGAFCLATFGISGLEFAPYAFLNILSPIVSCIMAYMGLGIVWKDKKNKGVRRFKDLKTTN